MLKCSLSVPDDYVSASLQCPMPTMPKYHHQTKNLKENSYYIFAIAEKIRRNFSFASSRSQSIW